MWRCDCYTIGGPWIGANPNCPRHGDAAVAERESRENKITELRNTVENARSLKALKAAVLKLLDDLAE